MKFTDAQQQAIEYDGEELIVVEQGTVTFTVVPDDHALCAGDSFHFKASIPHSWRNDGGAVATFTITGTLPRTFAAPLLQQRVAWATA